MKALFRGKILTIPNILSLIRVCLIPLFVWLYLAQDDVLATAIVLLLSGLTDALDGFIARHFNMISDFGKALDPFADKLMVLSALVCHGLSGVIPLSAIVIVGIKELIMIVGGFCLLNSGMVVYSNYLGKTATVFFVCAMVAGFFHKEFAAMGFPLDTILLWCSVALSVSALVYYVTDTARQILGKKEKVYQNDEINAKR